MNRSRLSISLICMCLSMLMYAQSSPDLEFASVSGDGNPTGNGPVMSTQISFNVNTNNPNGDTYELYSPSLKATFALSNQQYNNAALIGKAINNANAEIFPLLSSVGSPPNNAYTASGAPTGTGINTAKNRGVELLFNTAALQGQPTNGTYYMADLTITFNRPVNNPVLHLGGMGGFIGNMGITGGFEYLSSNVPISFSRLSGNSNSFTVTSTTIHNTATKPNTTGANSGSGSVLVTGTGITTIKLKLTARGSGEEPNWQSNSGSGDQVTFGISVLENNLSITKTADNPDPSSGSTINFTLMAKNNGPSNDNNVKVDDLLPDGYTFISSTASTGAYNSSTGTWNIGSLNSGASATLAIKATVNNTGNYTNTASISGTNGDSDSSDNIASVTPNVQHVCYNDANLASPGQDSKFGITTLKRASAGSNQWPGVRKSAHLVLESNSKGFVVTRLAAAEINNIVIPVEGMMIYDTTAKCLKIFADNQWSCFSQPACP